MPRFARGLILAWLAVPLALSGRQARKFYIANDDHTDYMWSANVEDYRTAFLQMLDYYLDLADANAGSSADFQSRFSCDGSFWLWTYEKNKPKSDFDRLIGRLKDGHISAPMTLLSLGYGGMPAEAVLRSLYYAGRLERRYGLKFKLALAQENQSLPYGLGALWAGAGASYSWKGICGCASRIPDAWDRIYDMYWWTGPDGSRILMKWYSQIDRDGYGIGGYAEARKVPAIISEAESSAEFRRRVPSDIVGLFGYGGDDLAARTDALVRVARQESTDSREVIVSNETDFFEDFERIYGGSLPSLGLSFGNEWELLNASLAEVSGSVKRGVEKLRSAEVLAALVALRDPAFMRGREDSRDQAWVDLGLFFEHDWTADGPLGRPARAAWERDRANGFLHYVDGLYRDASAALGRLIRKESFGRRFFVFNPLSWARSDFADFPLPGSQIVHVLDVTTGAEVPSQFIVHGTARSLRIWAQDVPSLGYKVFEIVPGAGQPFGGGPAAAGETLENSFYRAAVAPDGAIASLIDKRRGGRELVRSIDGLRLNELGPGAGVLTVENSGPVSASIKAVSPAPLSHETTITLFRDCDRIDIRNEITQNFPDLAAWSFGFDLDSPETWHEEIGALLQARTADKGGLYAPRAIRRDWLTLNHFADMSGGGGGVTISSADNQFFQLGRSTTAFLDTATPKISVLAGGQVDGPALGIPGQGGDSRFLQRFGLRSHGEPDAAEAMRFALEHQNPLVTGEVSGGAAYPAGRFSLFSIDDPNVVAWSVKPAEETSENRMVIRIWNLRPGPATASISFGDTTILSAQRVSHVETPIENAGPQGGRLTFSAAGGQWLSYSLLLEGQAFSGEGTGRKRIR